MISAPLQLNTSRRGLASSSKDSFSSWWLRLVNAITILTSQKPGRHAGHLIPSTCVHLSLLSNCTPLLTRSVQAFTWIILIISYYPTTNIFSSLSPVILLRKIFSNSSRWLNHLRSPTWHHSLCLFPIGLAISQSSSRPAQVSSSLGYLPRPSLLCKQKCPTSVFTAPHSVVPHISYRVMLLCLPS